MFKFLLITQLKPTCTDFEMVWIFSLTSRRNTYIAIHNYQLDILRSAHLRNSSLYRLLNFSYPIRSPRVETEALKMSYAENFYMPFN